MDEELRKCIELLHPAYILTGQEKPQGSQKGLREDLLKKLATAEGIMGRLPYQAISRMFKIVGWKRIECNQMSHFRAPTNNPFSRSSGDFVWSR